MGFEFLQPARPGMDITWGGKLPSTGDFIWSAQPTPLRIRLDHWLLGAMQQLRLAQGEDWQAGFERAPIWNFVFPAATLERGCVAGCISPSCDRVGRRFPFLVAYPLPASLPARALSRAVRRIPLLLSQTGALVFNGIRRHWPRDALIAQIERALASWAAGAQLPPGASADGSDILQALRGASQDDGQREDEPASAESTVPFDRFSSFPWGDDTASHLASGAASSFWWTNGADNAQLKAFTYGTTPDGALIQWLFGRPLA